MRITYDPEADAPYIYLTEDPLPPGRDSVPVDPPEGVQAMVVLTSKDGKIVGLEVLDAAALLHADLLQDAVPPRHTPTRSPWGWMHCPRHVSALRRMG